MMEVHLSCNVERLSKKLLMKFVARMSGVLELQEHPWKSFTYVSVGVGPLPMRFGLNLKYTHETGISTRP